MSTQWVITAAAERITLDAAKKGETTFTVTNPGRRADRAVFDVVVGDGADAAWFSVEDPQRLIKPAASASYLVKAAVPAGATPGTYEIQGRVFSADEAPEESSVLSPRVLLEVPVPPAPVKRRLPWWVFVVAGLVVLVIATVIWLVVPGGKPVTPTPTPFPTPSGDASPTAPVSAAPPAAGYAVMPPIVGVELPKAELLLINQGLKLGAVHYRYTPGGNHTVYIQYVPPGFTVRKGTAIEVDVIETINPPTLVTPAAESHLAKNAKPRVEWKQVETWESRWSVQVTYERCGQFGGCQVGAKPISVPETLRAATTITSDKFYDVPPTMDYNTGGDGLHDSGRVFYQICPLDLYGNNTGRCLNFSLYLDK